MRTEEAAYTVFVEPDEEAEEVTVDAPVVIAETRVDVPEATVSDAVMMLDLRNTNALLFKNAGTGRHNMVYRRGDGSIGAAGNVGGYNSFWIDSGETVKK